MKFYKMKEFIDLVKSNRPEIIEEILFQETELYISYEIIKKRTEMNLTQIELAEKSNLTQTQISRIENGELGNVKTLLKVLEVLNLRLNVINN